MREIALIRPFLALLAAAACLEAPLGAQSPVRPLPLSSWRWDASPRSGAPEGAREAVPRPAAGALRGVPVAASAQLPLPRIDAGTELDEARLAAELEGAAESFAQVSLFASRRGAAGLEGGGEVGLSRGGFDASIGRVSAERSWALHVRNEASFYDWQGPGFVGAGDPFNDMYLSRFGGEAEFGRDQELGLVVGAELALGGEDEASVADSLQVGGLVGMRLRASEEFSIDLGLAGLTRLEDDPWLLPYIGFDWRLGDSLRLASEGSEVHLDWRASERWTLGLEGVYEYRNYRLNEDGPLEGGAFRDEEIRLGLGIAFEATPGVTLEGTVGRVVWSEFGLHQDGERISEVEGGKATWIGIGLRASF